LKRFFCFLLLFLFSCASVETGVPFKRVTHVYLEPVTNKTPEESLDVLFTKVADEVFYQDPRFVVDKKPIMGTTLLVKPSVDSISTFSLGYDSRDRALKYKMTVYATVKLYRLGFKRPFKIFRIERYDFYSATGDPLEIERKRKECLRRIAQQIFFAVGEKLYAEGKEFKER